MIDPRMTKLIIEGLQTPGHEALRALANYLPASEQWGVSRGYLSQM